MYKILISACFLGENVRYNAEIKTLQHKTLSHWREEGRLIMVCPEVVGGLTTPRAPAEYNNKLGKVITSTGIDVTNAFNLGAQQALTLCHKYNIQFALLKESSPSCGSNTIYDGSFSNNKINGQGLTTTLLRRNNIAVYSEDNLTELTNKIATLENED